MCVSVLFSADYITIPIKDSDQSHCQLWLARSCRC